MTHSDLIGAGVSHIDGHYAIHNLLYLFKQIPKPVLDEWLSESIKTYQTIGFDSGIYASLSAVNALENIAHSY
ncbi:hypothetical protein HUU62_08790 [Rhodoferax sp. 4810]|uniref:Uncharacterized protein n=1 Tax=Thiospirillum jenense TaxID=1653858 RepID=A0A839HBC5_9GAMM|nr:hypothetical protein [Thiospirillum jenense]MBB1074506.1 hypothetical protein [Rhodoferax jenense]MBB1125510.1 hypothetical protein [Thiospirillum jenense]